LTILSPKLDALVEASTIGLVVVATLACLKKEKTTSETNAHNNTHKIVFIGFFFSPKNRAYNSMIRVSEC